MRTKNSPLKSFFLYLFLLLFFFIFFSSSFSSSSSSQLWFLSLHNSPPPLSLSCTRFLLLFWRVICFQRGRSEWVRAGGSVSASSLDMFRLKPFAPRNNLLWSQTAAGLLVSSGGNLKWFEYVGVFLSLPLFLWRYASLGSFEFKRFGHPYSLFEELFDYLVVVASQMWRINQPNIAYLWNIVWK